MKYIDETKPYIYKYSDTELVEISIIERKLKEALQENLEKGCIVKGITEDEAKKIIEWVIQRDRQLLTSCLGENLDDFSLVGCCRLSQEIVDNLLTNIGLTPRYLTIGDTIENYDGDEHGFSTVAIPIINESEKIEEKNILIDVTYRQFFLTEGYPSVERFIKDERFGNKVAPLPGYWCINLPGGLDFAKTLLRNGYIELTPENAKLYGDSFLLSAIRNSEYETKYQKCATIPIPNKNDLITEISDEQYFSNFIDYSKQSFPRYYDEGELESDYGIGIDDLQISGKSSPLKNREEQLSKLEKEALTISEAEALIDKQTEKEVQDIGE